MMPTDTVAENLQDHLGDLENFPEEALTPYEEFSIGDSVYYLTHGGFLYGKVCRAKEARSSFCGYLTDELWPYRTDDS